MVQGGRKDLLGGSYGRVTRERLAKPSPSGTGPLPQSDVFVKFADTYGDVPLVLTKVSSDSHYKRAYLESVSTAMENIVLSATALGLGTCCMPGPLRDKAFLRKTLDVPESMEIVALTSLGYSSEEGKAHLDRDISAKIRWIE